MFDPKPIIQQLETNQIIFKSLFSNLDEEAIRWKPSPEKWSLLEVIYHLIFEEEIDFRARCKYALVNKQELIPPIDPELYIQNLQLDDLEYPEALKEFLSSRIESISFLNSKVKEDANWDNNLIHPELGKLSAKLFLTNWLAHDHLHIKQILTLKNQYLAFKTQIDISYAGGF